MSAQVHERPTGEQPRLELPAESNPYPDGKRLARPFAPAPEGEPAPAAVAPAVPRFTPHPGGPRLDVRKPGAALDTHVPRAAREADPAVLRRTLAGLKRMPRPGEKIFAAAAAEHYGTGPQPASAPEEPPAVPAPAPVPGWPEGVVRGLLIAGLWDACRWYGDMDGAGCGDCEALGGLCGFHAPKYARHWEYSDLHDFCTEAASDAAALTAVAASARAGKADPADLASPGSHLDLILAGVLAADGGAR